MIFNQSQGLEPDPRLRFEPYKRRKLLNPKDMIKYALHKLKEGFIITSDEEISLNDSILNTKTLLIEVWRHPHITTTPYFKKVIAQQDQIDFSALSEGEQKEIKTPVKIEGYFEKNLFKITKIWENY
jgi:hypothetical protein